MKAEDYYRKIEEKWKNDYPSSNNVDEIWDFYEKEFGQHFQPVEVMREAGDLLGLYSCK